MKKKNKMLDERATLSKETLDAALERAYKLGGEPTEIAPPWLRAQRIMDSDLPLPMKIAMLNSLKTPFLF